MEINLFCRSISLNRNKLYDNMEQNDCLFNICITDRMENIFFEVLELLGHFVKNITFNN